MSSKNKKSSITTSKVFVNLALNNSIEKSSLMAHTLNKNEDEFINQCRAAFRDTAIAYLNERNRLLFGSVLGHEKEKV